MIILKFQGGASAPPCPVLPAPMAPNDWLKRVVDVAELFSVRGTN